MKEMDCVELTVEKEKYAKHGVHMGMRGWVCHPECIQDSWLVNFPQCGEHEDIATIAIKEKDLKKVDALDANENERIKEQHGD